MRDVLVVDEVVDVGQGILPTPPRLLSQGAGHFFGVNGPDGVEGVAEECGGEQGLPAGPVAGDEETKPGPPEGMKARTRPTTANTFVKRDAKRGRDKLPDDAPLGWAELLKRVFGVDGLECQDCGKRMRLRTVVEGSSASKTIVTGLLRSTGPPAPRRGGDDQGGYAGA